MIGRAAHEQCSLSTLCRTSLSNHHRFIFLFLSLFFSPGFLLSSHHANATVADIATDTHTSPFTLLSTSISLAPVPLPTPDSEGAFLLSEARHPASPVGRIPLIVHYVYGLRPGKSVTFELDDFISVKSAFDILGAERVLFWVRNIPSGQWWDEMLAMGKRRAQKLGLTVDNCIELKQVRDVETVFGRKVESSAHKADVIRMEALLTYGGIYMDMDVVALKPMDALMERHSTILGQEQTADGTHPHGLGNAYMLTHKAAPFFYQWYQAYKKFDFNQWAALSIHLPIRLSRSLPQHVYELGPEAFYWPSFDDTGKQQMYFADTFDLSHNYAVHLWSGGKPHRQGQKTFDDLCALNNTWGRIARTVLLAGDGNANLCHGRGIA